MKNKVIGLFLLIAFIWILCGCEGEKYNALIHNQAEKWISEDFLNENRVKAFYINETYIEGESEPSSKYIYDESAPSFRTFFITQQMEFIQIFSKYNEYIDFENNMVLLYIFSDVNPGRDYYIKNIKYENQVLTIHIKLENKKSNDSTAPYQRCLMIEIEKLEIDSINFIKD